MQAAGHPAGLGAGVDLPGAQRPHAGGGDRRRGPAAVPLSPAVADQPGQVQARPGADRGGPAARRPEGGVKDLRLEGMPYERALATAFRLLDLGFFRIGGEAYAEANNSYGLATIRGSTCRSRGPRWSSTTWPSRGRSATSRWPTTWSGRPYATCAAAQRRAGAAGVPGREDLARRQLRRHQRLHQGTGGGRGVGQGLPHLARHGDRRRGAGRGEREGPDRPRRASGRCRRR